MIPGLFFDLYWSRTTVFCCASPVYTGITQNRLLYLTAAPREGCGSSPRTWVLELGEVIYCTITSPWDKMFYFLKSLATTNKNDFNTLGLGLIKQSYWPAEVFRTAHSPATATLTKFNL